MPKSQDNQEISQLLDEWFSQPDKMGTEFWQEYERELDENPFMI